MNDSPKASEALWKKHTFRVLLSPDQLKAYVDGLEAEYPRGKNEHPIGAAPNYNDAFDKKENLTTFSPTAVAPYTLLYKALYYSLDLLSKFQKRRKSSSRSKPLRVLRMVSLISQGGVAKVCQQSLLPMPTERVAFTVWPFNEKKGSTPELEQRPDIKRIARKMELWPCRYRYVVIRNVFKLARMLRRERPDLIHLHEPQFAPTVRMAAILAGGIPLCVHLHNDYNIRRNSIHDRLHEVTRDALRKAHLITCSETIDRAARTWLAPLKHQPCLIFDGADDIVEEQQVDDGLPEGLAKAAKDKIVVCMMSNLAPHKRIDDYLAGCRILLDLGYPLYVTLMCYGKSKAGRLMRRKFNDLFAPEEGEFFYKVVSPQRLMHRIDLGVSTSALEGLGLNILEYQVEGVPVVCSNLFPHREMVTDGETGLLFEGLDIPDFVRTMRRALDDADLRKKIGEAGRESARKRHWSKTALDTAEFYESLLK